MDIVTDHPIDLLVFGALLIAAVSAALHCLRSHRAPVERVLAAVAFIIGPGYWVAVLLANRSIAKAQREGRWP